jgi:hypothetical protein
MLLKKIINAIYPRNPRRRKIGGEVNKQTQARATHLMEQLEEEMSGEGEEQAG